MIRRTTLRRPSIFHPGNSATCYGLKCHPSFFRRSEAHFSPKDDEKVRNLFREGLGIARLPEIQARTLPGDGITLQQELRGTLLETVKPKPGEVFPEIPLIVTYDDDVGAKLNDPKFLEAAGESIWGLVHEWNFAWNRFFDGLTMAEVSHRFEGLRTYEPGNLDFREPKNEPWSIELNHPPFFDAWAMAQGDAGPVGFELDFTASFYTVCQVSRLTRSFNAWLRGSST